MKIAVVVLCPVYRVVNTKNNQKVLNISLVIIKTISLMHFNMHK